MKRIALLFIAFIAFNSASAQFDLSILDKASGLLDKGDNANAGGLLNDAIAGITKEVSGSQTSFAPKITSQLGTLGTLASGLSGGNSNASGIKKVINTIKTLVAANRLKSALGGGSLLGKGNLIGQNTNILSSGLSLLGGDNKSEVSKVTDMLGLVSKNSSKLDGSSLVAKGAEKIVSENLGSSLGILEKLF